MKLLFLGNMNDIHTPKWAQFFIDKGHDCKKFHVGRFSVKKLLELRNVIQFWKPDILHAHYAGTWGTMGALTGFHRFVVTVHGSEVLLNKGWRLKLTRWILGKAHIITTDGVHVMDKLAKEWSIPKTKIKKINFGVDVEKFKPNDGTKYPMTVAYRVGNDLIYDKNTVVRCIKKLFFESKKINWFPIEDLIEEEIIHLLQHMNVYISTALSDAGLSSTTAEAMACGLPVIVSDVADNRRWVGHACQLFQPGNHVELAEKIAYFLSHPKHSQRYGRDNRNKIVKFNNYHIEMGKMEKIYKQEALSYDKEEKQ